MGLLLAGALGGAYLLGRQVQSDGELPATLVQAMASHSGETMALATGPVDEGQEGLFVLDYLTGELQCYVCYPRNGGKIGAKFRTNVVQVLGVEQGKKPSYALVTGMLDFTPRPAGVARPGSSVVYVCDTNTGNIAIFGVPWNRNAASTNQLQQGALVLIDVAKARNLDVIE